MEQAVTSKREKRVDLRNVLLSGIGLACWISTLLLFSSSNTALQKFENLQLFIRTIPEEMLVVAAILSIIIIACALLKHFLRRRLLLIAGGTFYTAGVAVFALCAYFGIPGEQEWIIGIIAIVVGIGSVLTALTWGRVYKDLVPRNSVLAIAIAGLCTALLYFIMFVLPGLVCVGAYCVLALLASVFPLIAHVKAPSNSVPLSETAEQTASSVSTHFRSFVIVIAPSFIGLLLFSFTTGLFGEHVVETHTFQIVTLCIDALLLGVFAIIALIRPFSRSRYRIPAYIFALAFITVLAILGTLNLDGDRDIAFILLYLLYFYVALLSLADIAAVSHAGEFASDLVVAAAFALHCIVSIVGMRVGRIISDEVSIVVMIIATIVYALAMMIVLGLRSRGDSAISLLSSLDVVPENEDVAASTEVSTESSADQVVASELDLLARCAELVEEYQLTTREAQILDYLIKGYGSSYIADELCISPDTVRTHVFNIRQKFGVSSRDAILDFVRKS